MILCRRLENLLEQIKAARSVGAPLLRFGPGGDYVRDYHGAIGAGRRESFREKLRRWFRKFWQKHVAAPFPDAEDAETCRKL